MQERVTPSNDHFAEIVVQYNHDLMNVGIGLAPRADIPGLHFIDAIYGDRTTQAAIGKIFVDQARTELNYGDILDFPNKEIEVEWYDKLGRVILNAVTGSKVDDGMWTWLDRPATNRLIRLLRKARDSAFGRDE